VISSGVKTGCVKLESQVWGDRNKVVDGVQATPSSSKDRGELSIVLYMIRCQVMHGEWDGDELRSRVGSSRTSKLDQQWHDNHFTHPWSVAYTGDKVGHRLTGIFLLRLLA
jgi:hypothetical protein